MSDKYTETVYVVRDASGEYVKNIAGDRTPASNEAHEFDSRQQALAHCTRATDTVVRMVLEAE